MQDADAAIVEAMARAMRIDADGGAFYANNDDDFADAWRSSARAALAAIRAAGWAVVPREATDAMLKASYVAQAEEAGDAE